VAAPASILTLLVSGAWYRFKNAPWRKALQAGLQPVTAGLVMASAALLIQSTTTDWTTAAVVVVTAALFLSGRLHPMAILAAAALVGAMGLAG